MRCSPTQQVHGRVGQILVLLSLLVLCLGLPRLLVVCSGPHCHGSIEFVHASGSCCQEHHEVEVGCGAHEHAQGDDDDGDYGEGDAAEPSRSGCTDVALSIAEGPLPERITFELLDAPATDLVDSWLVDPPSAQPATVLPPPTGPPRTDQRTELLATTVLLI